MLLILTPFLLIFNGCSGVKGMLTFTTDISLPKPNNLKALSTIDSVGLEWKKINDPRITGYNIYRGKPVSNGNQKLERVATVGSRHATHYVDLGLTPQSDYIYSVSSIALGKESIPSDPVFVKTKAWLAPVTLTKAYRVEPRAVKVLWAPHAHPSVSGYVIERRINGTEWIYYAEVRGRLMPEFIDKYVKPGNSYEYRIKAKSCHKTISKPGPVAQLAI